MKPKLLDLFCGAGGAAMGYHRAGFEVVGVDIKPQPHYPFEFHQADALEYPLEGFDVYHASPPCQGYSPHTKNNSKWVSYSLGKQTPKLIKVVKELLQGAGKPLVIENVMGSRDEIEANLISVESTLNEEIVELVYSITLKKKVVLESLISEIKKYNDNNKVVIVSGQQNVDF